MIFFTSWRGDKPFLTNLYNFIMSWIRARKYGARIALGKYEGAFEPSLVCSLTKESLAYARKVMEEYNQDCILLVIGKGEGYLEYPNGEREYIGKVKTLPAQAFFKKENATLTTQGCIVVGE